MTFYNEVFVLEYNGNSSEMPGTWGLYSCQP